MKGWIKLHRKVREHWLWKDPQKFQWWLIMLLEVNFQDGKMMLGNTLIKVPRGSSTNSIRTWAALFNCGTKATTNFFDLLESDNMIIRKTLGKGKHSTTLINITNYNEFQSDKETLTDTIGSTLTDTQRKHERHTIEEANNDNNLRSKENTPPNPQGGKKPNSKKFTTVDFKKTLKESGVDDQHLDDWIKVRQKKKAANTRTALDKFLNECKKNDFSIPEAVKICAEKSWSGFKVEWLKNSDQKFKKKSFATNRGDEPTINRQSAETIHSNSQGW